jgi:hypothetical protein
MDHTVTDLAVVDAEQTSSARAFALGTPRLAITVSAETAAA